MDSPKKREYYIVVPSSYLFFRDGENILLSLRKNTGYRDGEYSLPAGHIETGEYPIAAAIREAKEETSVDINLADIELAHTMYRLRDDHSRVEYFFVVKKWNGELSNAEPAKCGGLDWFPLEQLPENTIPYIRTAIERYAKGDIYSEFEEKD